MSEREREKGCLQDEVAVFAAEVDSKSDGFEKFVFRSLLQKVMSRTLRSHHEGE